MDQFDYVILGGGTAGCILANRLSASGRHRVLLVEAGGTPRSPYIRLPAGFGNLLRSPPYDWGYESEPHPDTNDRRIPLPSGRGLGGRASSTGWSTCAGQAARTTTRGPPTGPPAGHGPTSSPGSGALEDYAQGGEVVVAEARPTSPRCASASRWPTAS